MAGRLRAAGYAGRTVALKVRFADFTTITRSRTLREATDVGQEIYATARALYEALGLQRARIRLVGVRLEGLVDAETGAPSSCCSTHPSTAGGRPSWRSTRRRGGSAPGRCGPASLVLHRWGRSRSARSRGPSDPGAQPDRGND